MIKIIILCASIVILLVVFIIVFLIKKRSSHPEGDKKTATSHPWAYESKRPIAWVETSRKSKSNNVQSDWSLSLVLFAILILVAALIFSETNILQIAKTMGEKFIELFKR